MHIRTIFIFSWASSQHHQYWLILMFLTGIAGTSGRLQSAESQYFCTGCISCPPTGCSFTVKTTSLILLVCPNAVFKHYKTRHDWNKQLTSWLRISTIHQWQRPKLRCDSPDILSKKPHRPILMTRGGASHCRSSVQLFFLQTISLCLDDTW